MKTGKKILSILMAFAMLMSLFDTMPNVLAAEPAARSTDTVSPKIVLVGSSNSCLYHYGDDMTGGTIGPATNGKGNGWDGYGRGTYDGGTVTVQNSGSSASLYLKERAHFKNASYLLQPFTLSVNVPAYTTYTVDFTYSPSMNRNAKGSSLQVLELVDNAGGVNGAAYSRKYSTKADLNYYGEKPRSRSHSNAESYYPSLTKTFVFANDTGTAKDVALPLALLVGNSKSTSSSTDYHHQQETKITFTTQKVTAAKTIRYDSAGGSAVSNVTYTDGSVKLALAPTRTGYNFTGWKDKNGSTVYQAGATYSGNSGLDLAAQWTAKTPTVTFNANGGSVSTASKTVTYNGTYGDLPTPTKGGYAFGGWYTAASGGSQVENTTKVTKIDNHTLYAHWTAKDVAVTLNANGGTVTPASITVKYDGTYSNLSTPTRSGYTFGGWYTAQSGGSKVENTTKVENASAHTLYARWTAKSVSVTLNANGGTVSGSPVSVTYDGTYGTLPAPTRSGYTFGGWYTAASGGTQVTSTTTVKTAASHTLYARWSRNTYTITFNSNGGSAVASCKVNAGDPLGTLPANPTKTGYTFAGWFTASTGGSQITATTTVNADTTCYARWTAKSISVTLNANGGTVSGSPVSVTYDRTYGNLPIPTRTGYNFAGWYTAASGGSKVENTTTVKTAASHTLYAHWTAKNDIVVTLNGNGATVSPSSITVTYDGTYSTLRTDYSRIGYKFDGWYTAASGGTQVTGTTKVENAGNHTLYAHWTGNTYTVTFDGNGGSVTGGTEKTVTYGQPYGAMPVATSQTGKTFTGWYTAKNSGTYKNASTPVTEAGNHTLYAGWADKHEHKLSNTSDDIRFGGLGTTANAGAGISAASDVLGKEISSEASYYLSGDIEIGSSTTIKTNGTLTLCLNGHKLTYTGTGESIFVVEGGGKLNICDCNGSNGSHSFTSPVTGQNVTIQGGLVTRSTAYDSIGGAVKVDGTFNLYSGTIAGIQSKTKNSHGAVRVQGVFHMYGGELCHNKMGTGAGVNVCNAGSHFYLHGGSIHHNYAWWDDGGGVCLNSNASFTMSGGEIRDNKAVSGAGGIHCYDGGSGTVTISGGSITGNTTERNWEGEENDKTYTVGGAGVIYDVSRGITLSGNPVITGNTNYENKPRNLYVWDDPVLKLADGGLTDGADIGVTSKTVPAAENKKVPIGIEGSGGYARYFTADVAGQTVYGEEGGKLYLGIHSHPVCGETCSHTDPVHTGVETFKELTADMINSGSLSGGSYYLTGDITTSTQIKIRNGAAVNLCLNGHTISSSAGQSLQIGDNSTSGSGTLNLCDCQGGGAVTSSGVGITNLGKVNMYGGSVTSSGNSGIVNQNSDAQTTILGGTVTGSGSSSSGVSLFSGGTLTLGGSPTIHGTDCDISVKISEKNDEGKITVLGSLKETYSVKTSTDLKEGESYAFTTAASTNYSGRFTAAQSGCFIRSIGEGNNRRVELYKPHFHGGAEYTYTPLTAENGTTLSSGSYFLTGDLTASFTVPENATVDLCLNGHTLTGKVEVNGTLNLYDCSTGKTGTITNTDRVITGSGAFNWYGGTLDGGSDSNANYVPIYTDGSVALYNTPAINAADACEYEIRGNSEGFLHIGGALVAPAGSTKPYRVNFGDAAEVNITNKKQVTLTTGWADNMGDADPKDYFAIAANRYAKIEKDEASGELVLRLLCVTIDGTVYYPAYKTGKITLPSQPETPKGQIWEGWYDAETGGNKVELTNDKVYTDDITLYSHWKNCDHTGNTSTDKTPVLAAACTEPGAEKYICSVCGLEVEVVIEAKGHSFDTTTWHKDEHEVENEDGDKVTVDAGTHSHKCTRDGCDIRDGASAHIWNDGEVTTPTTVSSEGVTTYTCTAEGCGATKTEPIPKLSTYTVTYTVDEYTIGTVPTQTAVTEGTEITLPAGGLTRTGYNLAGWALFSETGTLGENPLTGSFTMHGRNVTFQVRWSRIDDYQLKPGESIVLEDGTTIKNETGKTVTIDQNGDGTAETTITLPDGTTAVVIQQDTKGEEDKVIVPPGSTVTTKPAEGGENGPVITIGGGSPDGSGSENGKVDSTGTVEAPTGSTLKDKEGNTVTITEGSGVINPDGNITFPPTEGKPDGGGKVTVTDKDNNTTEIPVTGESEGVESNGFVPPPNDPDKPNTVVLPDGTEVDLPAGGGVVKNEDDSHSVPAGSTITNTDDEGNKTIVTIPDGDVGGTIKPDGDITVPSGSKVETEDSEGNKTETTVPDGGTVKPGGNVEAANHTHDWASGWTANTNNTHHYHECTAAGCGITNYATCGEAGAAYGAHTEDKGGVTTEPTCTDKGTKTYKCTVCDTVLRTEEIDATDHTWGAWSITTKPTAEAEGTAERVCEKDSTHKDTFILPALTDTSVWTEGTKVEPTEDADGSQEYTSEYGKVTVTIPALNHTHDWGAWSIKSEPTMEASGILERICTKNSSHTETKEVPALTDTTVWTEGTKVEPTEDADGSQEYTSEYGTVTVTIPALNHTHDWGAWSIKSEPTMEASGILERICTKNSAHTETKEVPALTDTSVWTEGTKVEPTEDADGSQEYDSEYGKVTVTIPATGHTHDWGAWSIKSEPTTEAEGTAERTCTKNSEHKETVTLSVLTDTAVWTAGTRTEPTETTDGSQEYTSDYGTVTITIPATGGSGDNPGTQQGTVSKDVEQGENAPETSISTEKEELADTLLTDAEKQLVQDGTDIRIVLEVQDAGNKVAEPDKADLEEALNGFAVGQYLDINLYKLAGETRTDITETEKKIRIVITVPDGLKNADSEKTRTFAVIRVHGGETEVLNDLDDSADTITIDTDRFSTYAIVYKDAPNDASNGGNDDNGNQNDDSGNSDDSDDNGNQNADSGNSDGSDDNGNQNADSGNDDNSDDNGNQNDDSDNSNNADNSNNNNNSSDKSSSPNKKDDEPKTGDAAPLELYATLAMIAGFAYLLLYFINRKWGMTEETKKELVSRLIGWAKRGGRTRKYLALAAIFVLLVYYHSVGKKIYAEWKEAYGG